MQKYFYAFILIITFQWPQFLLAETAAAPAPNVAGSSVNVKGDPYQVVQQTSQAVLDFVRKVSADYEKDPGSFNAQVLAIMDPVVDFDYFARSVMGTYASEARYNSLKTDAEKQAFKANVQRFSDMFKQGLVDTYGKYLFKFNGDKIETLPPRKGDNINSGQVAVMQNIKTGNNKPFVVQYSMRKNKAGEWKLQNVIVEGINLGQTYRTQFAQVADKYHGDLTAVINNWQVTPQTALESAP
ncbi:MAG TPA: ABC transporter substrate-binding protein [Cellvibrionaceae bacterium]